MFSFQLTRRPTTPQGPANRSQKRRIRLMLHWNCITGSTPSLASRAHLDATGLTDLMKFVLFFLDIISSVSQGGERWRQMESFAQNTIHQGILAAVQVMFVFICFLSTHIP